MSMIIQEHDRKQCQERQEMDTNGETDDVKDEKQVYVSPLFAGTIAYTGLVLVS